VGAHGVGYVSDMVVTGQSGGTAESVCDWKEASLSLCLCLI
jgi:hypothetical protein